MTTTKLRIAPAILAVLFGITVTSCSHAAGERKTSLRGSWRFILGDNINFSKPDFDDASWEKVYVPSSWQEEGFSRYNGYAWYRTTFHVDFENNEILYIELGRIDDSDEVYVNGKLVGRTGGFPPDYFTGYHVHRNYLIPTELLKSDGENVVAVRVYDHGGEGGILGSRVGIYSYDDYIEDGFSLMGNWKFHLFDDKTWSREDLDDNGWENIAVPSSWEDQGFGRYDGFAWYRKKFTLPANMKDSDMVLILGKIDDMDQVFINGQPVGATGDIERKWADDGEWERPRNYFIPDRLLRPGQQNVVAVRVYDQLERGGIYEGPVVIIPRSDYRDFYRRYRNENYSFGWWSLLDWD